MAKLVIDDEQACQRLALSFHTAAAGIAMNGRIE
jgi:hypothetical protein